MESIVEYYATLYKGLEGSWVVASRFGPDPSPINIPIQPSGLASLVIDQAEKFHGNLFSTFAVFATPQTSGRGTNQVVAAIPGVFLDIDVSDSGRYAVEGRRSVSLSEIRGAVKDWGLPEPSAIVSSGNGYHFEWRLDQPFIFSGEVDRQRATDFLKSFNGFAIGKAKALGWKLDSMGDLARVKRAVGSINWKDRGNPKPVELAEFHPELTYSLEALEAFKPVATQPAPKPIGRAAKPGEAKAPEWQSVVAGCRFARHVEADAAHLREPEWYATASLVGRW